MKQLKKIIVLALALCMVLPICACADQNAGFFTREKDQLNILVFDGGYGTEYVQKVAEAFMAEYPGITVNIDSTKEPLNDKEKIMADKYVADIVILNTNLTAAGIKGKVYELTDVYNSYAFGESDKTILEKLGETADANEFDGKYYQLSVQPGATGVCYNKVYLDAIYGEGNWEIPLTSKQFTDMCDDIKSRNAWATVYTNSTDAEYAVWLRDYWTVQYTGYEEYCNYYNLQYTDASGNVVTAKTAEELNASIRSARESALSQLINVMSYKLGYAPESCAAMNFSQAQAYFVGYTAQTDVKEVNGHKGAAFSLNGDWLYAEVERYGEAVELDIRFMRTPINSDIIDRLSTVNSEDQLVECVKYIDSVLDGTEGTRPAYLSDEDYKELYDARRMVWSTHAQQIAAVPVTCSDVDVAKDFLKFMASDSSSLMVSDAMSGMKSIFNSEIYSESKLTNFTASINYALATDPLYVTGLSSPYNVYGSLGYFRYYYFQQALYNATGATDVKNIIDWTENDLKSKWNDIVASYEH